MPGLGLPIPDAGSPPLADGANRVGRGSFRVTATNSPVNTINTMNRIALPVAVIGPDLKPCHHTVRSEAATAPIHAL